MTCVRHEWVDFRDSPTAKLYGGQPLLDATCGRCGVVGSFHPIAIRCARCGKPECRWCAPIGPELPVATWHMDLLTDCPGCGESVDLLDGSDFWESRVEPCETTDIYATCPRCKHEWRCSLVW